ncbi:MAG: hypothetical protein A3A33_00540 [Candidatus Yanofskybacteria bacterium RIFCSPLOWO2_01_FULL_49_25]|uniref:N-acetyltransferase domain-containing protein n=1 Tax=Candidatus Yanofskybacteria bacterium RIFCSPLOWO2_01_FULL_49_25 TaxID=1802701 RepID=A0A1F8GT39_9BACT|nr:MAG: hypothetical protein A3A33_00540 [Candidatus Yanofskybacteria bacterium RIFCSPLOWO2_01_FULL_49_25]
MIKFEQLTQVTTKALEEINILVPQVSNSANALTYSDLLAIVKDNGVTLLTVKDGAKIIGFGTFAVYHSISGTRGRIDHTVIDESYRGQGLGEKLTRELIKIAREKKVKRVELTSRSSHVAANKLFQKIGFEKHETNMYRLNL